MLQRLARMFDVLFGVKHQNSSGASEPRVLPGVNSPDMQPASSAAAAISGILPLLDFMSDVLRETAYTMQLSVQQVGHDFSAIAATSRDAVDASRRGLDVYCDHDRILREINDSLQVISQIADEAGIVGMNGRLEAARSPQCTAAFNVVATETGHLSEQTARARERIQQAVHQLHSMNRGLHTNLQKTEDLSLRLTNSIQSTVVGLQFQDLAFQRIIAVVDALQEIRRTLLQLPVHLNTEEIRHRQRAWYNWFHHYPAISTSQAAKRY